MKIMGEFKAFAVKGNVVDMAVGIMIGGAFGKIVTSLVNDVLMPPIGLLLGGKDFSRLVITLKAATETAPAVTMNYGKCIQTTIDFLIVAWAMFILVKAINAIRLEEEKKNA